MLFLAKPENNNEKPNTRKEERAESNIKRYKKTRDNRLIFSLCNLKNEFHTQSTGVLIKYYFVVPAKHGTTINILCKIQNNISLWKST